MEFEWDDDKAESNLRDHGWTFEQGTKAFLDDANVEWIDDREDYGEERWILLGMCEGTILHVTYTERGIRFRLISVRKATKQEQDYYYRENSS